MNNITKVIFFIESPFCQRDYDRFGLEILIQDGFEVHVWDFTPFINPEVYRRVQVPDPIAYEKYRLFFTKREAVSAILKESHGLFVVLLIGYGHNAFPVFRALSKNKIPYSVFMANALPSVIQKLQPIDVLKKILRATPGKIINSVFVRIQNKYLGIKPARFILAGGENSTHYRYPVDQKTETLWLHTLDYDIYLHESNNSVLEINQNTGVFLDEYVPFHPDYILLKISPYATPEQYYPSICRFFDCLEEKHGVNINIAAHPRSKYEELPDYFGGRAVIKGKTVHMIRESGFVIAHSSTALNFAVLCNKPVIFITTNKLQQSPQRELIELMASWFGKLPINIDNPIAINWDKELIVDEKAYARYKNCFIKKNGSEDIPFWQSVSKRIQFFEV